MKALSPIAVLISALLLQGCVAAAVVGTAAVGTKAAPYVVEQVLDKKEDYYGEAEVAGQLYQTGY